MTDLRIVPSTPEPTSQDKLVEMLKRTLLLAKEGKLSFAVVVSGNDDEAINVAWQGSGSIAFVRGAVTGLEAAKLGIIQSNVKFA